MRHFIHLTPEVQSAADWQARHGLDGSLGTRLPELMSKASLDEINANPMLFKLCVHMAKAKYVGGAR